MRLLGGVLRAMGKARAGPALGRTLSTESTATEEPPPPSENVAKLGGFAKAFRKHTSDAAEPAEASNTSFSSMLRNSKFIDLGDPKGKVVHGEVFDIIEDDLYIDFGWKFHCVCSRPRRNPEDYVIGTKVRLLINDLELSTRFLGADTDITLLEADCRILNVTYTPVRR